MNFSTDNQIIDGTSYFLDRKILNFTNRCKSTLDLSDEFMTDILDLDSRSYSKFQNGSQSLNIIQFSNFLKQFNLTIESFLKDKVDYESLRKWYGHRDICMPEKYQQGARSKNIAIIHILDYVEEIYGWQVVQQALDFLQIPASIKSNPTDAVSVTLVQDLLLHLKTKGLSNQDIWNVGIYSVSKGHHQKLVRDYKKCECPSTLYKFFFEEIVPQVDKNNTYRFLEMSEEHCVVESIEIPELLDELQVQHVGGIERCIYRLSILHPFTDFLELPRPKLFETHCVHKGDSSCRFRVDYGHAYYDFKRGRHVH